MSIATMHSNARIRLSKVMIKRKDNNRKFNALTDYKHWMMSVKFEEKFDDTKLCLSKMSI